MKEPGDIGGVSLLGIVLLVVVGAIEKQADMHRLAALAVSPSPLLIATLFVQVRLTGLQAVVSAHCLQRAR
ncbi:hypothetical protein D9M70_595850 [compost metagenome]